MNESLTQLITRLSNDLNLLNSVEEATKQGAILPVLAQLGWDCFNLEEVVPEFTVGNGRIDYCLRLKQKNYVFIEVKRSTENLERHEKQLLEYSFEGGVDIAVLTNGLLWWFYLPLVGGDWQQRKFYAIDIMQQKPEAAALSFSDFLSRDSIVNGTAIKKAKTVKRSREKNRLISEAIPNAWRKILEEPDELLLEIMADRVESICGHQPDSGVLSEFLKDWVYRQESNSQTPLPYPMSTQSKKVKKTMKPDDVTPKRASKQKGAVVHLGEKTIRASTVGELYYEVLRYICDNNFINKAKSEIPYSTSSKRYLISKEPYHQRGNKFRMPVEYNGYYMEAHKSYEIALGHLEKFLKICGLILKY